MSVPENSFLLLLKLDFYRIVSSHEHFVPLNLPHATSGAASAPSSPTPSCSSTSSQLSYTSTNTLTERGLYTELSTDYRSKHFLVGLILSELIVAIECRYPVLVAIKCMYSMIVKTPNTVHFVCPWYVVTSPIWIRALRSDVTIMLQQRVLVTGSCNMMSSMLQ